MEALLKERFEIRRRFQADKDGLMLQLEEERRNTEKEIERFDKRQKSLKAAGANTFQKLQKRKNIKTRQYLEKEIERLQLQLRDSKVREARSTEMINILLLAGLCMQGKKWELMKSKEREVQSTEMTNALVKEREEMKKELHEEKEKNVLELEKERKNLEKRK
ncbi:trichohyalin-like [Tachysurus ichikawai]